MYTIQVHSDDGFALRVNGSEFTSVYGNGVIDADDPQTIFHEANTADSNTRGVIELSAGVHTFDAFTWNSLEGAYMEISSAKGEFPYHKASWLAIGDDSVVAEQTLHPIAKLTGPMFVGNLNDAFDQELDLERDNLLAAQAGGTLDATHDTSTTFHMDDDRFALSCPFSENPEFHAAETTFQWPNTDGDINNFASIMTGSFVVDDRDGEAGETMPVSFHIDSDGRSSFRVIGQDFDAVMDDELVELDGDESMFANRGVCNTNYTGTITLTEGVEYDFEAIHVEGSGDSGMQLLVAPGDHVDEFDKSAFVVVGTEAFVIPENPGLALVDPSGGLPGDFDGDADLDADDIDLLSLEVEAMTNNVAFDLTGDSLTNAADRTEWVETLKGTFFGDANLDNSVTFEDFLVLSDSFGGAGGWALGDFDGDGNIAFADFLLLSNNFGSSAQAASAVPEPASWYLFGLGSLIVFARIKRSNP
jgi:hypothetical protein